MKQEKLTIFTCPKAFNEAYDVIQRNAIKSWKLLRPEPRIILFTDNKRGGGVERAAIELGVEFGGVVKCNAQDTPLVNDLWARADEIASTRLLAYVNADIVLMSDWLSAISLIEFSRFLAIGRRWDWQKIDKGKRMSPDAVRFDDTWEERLRIDCKKIGNWHPPGGLDYFVFTKGLYGGGVPSFAIGRYAWDNWLAAEALRLNVPLVDITEAAFVVHQRHAYGNNGELTGADLLETPEAKSNIKLHHSLGVPNTALKHATHAIIKNGTQYIVKVRKQENGK